MNALAGLAVLAVLLILPSCDRSPVAPATYREPQATALVQGASTPVRSSPVRVRQGSGATARDLGSSKYSLIIW